MNIVGTPCRPVQRSASTVSSVASGSKPSGGADHAGAVGDAGQIAQHHAEAMIIGHRNAKPVRRRQPHRLADEITVVDDVVMRQRRALGRARRAGSELDVDRIVELQPLAQRGEIGKLRAGRRRGDIGEIQHACGLFDAEPDDGLEVRQPGRRQGARRGGVDLGRQSAQAGEIVVALESGAENQRLAADLAEGVFGLVTAVGGIDVDQDQACLRGGELGEDPLAVVGRPDADALARLEAKREQSGGEIVGAPVEFGVAPAHALMTRRQRRAVRRRRGHALEQGADGFADERRAARAVNVALRQSGHGAVLPP